MMKKDFHAFYYYAIGSNYSCLFELMEEEVVVVGALGLVCQVVAGTWKGDPEKIRT